MVAYKVGERVKYHAVGGQGPGTETSITIGEIVDVITKTQTAGSTGVAAKASDAQPRYLIRNDNTGKETAYKVENILGRA